MSSPKVKHKNTLSLALSKSLTKTIATSTLLIVSSLCLPSCAASSEKTPPATTTQTNKHLTQFASKQAFDEFFAAQKKKQKKQRSLYEQFFGGMQFGDMATAEAPKSAVEGVAGATNASGADNITNNQHAGVDEGGIVKKVGNTLVVLRRGRLFTVNIADGKLKKGSLVNAYASGIKPEGTWYDEMLIQGNTVIVIGYSYQRGGTEIGLFELDKQGKLTHKNTYNMRSSDYYSAENYASRLVNNQLVFYTPLHINYHKRAEDSLPAIRQWQVGTTKNTDAFTPTIQTQEIYELTAGDIDTKELFQTLHTVTRCDIANFKLNCHSTSVIGDYGRVFYVSPTAVFAWIQRRTEEKEAHNGYLLQIPLNGDAPSSMQVKGSPFDQLSFLQKNNQLYVLLQENGYGDGMWAKHFGSGKMSLLNVPLSKFGGANTKANLNQYHPVPRPQDGYINNRYVGEHLVYGLGNGWYDPEKNEKSTIYTVNLDGFNVNQVSIDHVAERIERLGKDALVVGSTGTALGMTSVKLSQNPPKVMSTYQFKGANQGESRTHGFFYSPLTADTGWLGLPIIRQDNQDHSGATHQLTHGSAAVTFLQNKQLQLSPIGQLGSSVEGKVEDNCQASCVDWYGNARPIFVGKRVFALMGYELVEGKVVQKDKPRIEEVARLDMLSAIE